MNQQKSDLESLASGGSVADVVLAYPALRPELEKLGVDYCCGGKRPFAEAVKASGLDVATVMAACREALEKAQAGVGGGASVDWSVRSLTELAQHILDRHHVYTREQLARCDGLLGKVQKAHGDTHGAMLEEARRLFDALRTELETHMMKEERVLFPAIFALDAHRAGTQGRPSFGFGRLENPIRQMEAEHDEAGRLLAGLRNVTDNYRLPADACMTFGALFDGLPELEEDLHEHIHLENNLLFPKSIELDRETAGE